MPKVSVIIPAFNAERYIQNTLESVFEQTYKDYEVIVVNDGSTDSTQKILDNYGPRIRVFTKTNRGPASARNMGIKKASGKYIAFLDADDLWLKNKLKMQVEYLDSHPKAGFVYCNAICFSGDDKSNETVEAVWKCNIKGSVFKNLFWNNFIPNLTVVVRKSCLESVNLLDESQQIIGSEDYDLFLRLSHKYELGHVPQVLAKYRLHQENLLGYSYEKAFRLHKYIYKKLFSIISDLDRELGVSYATSLCDLHLRYAYYNFVNRQYLLALKKSLSAIKYQLLPAVIASILITSRFSNKKLWQKIIPNFELWDGIVRIKS
jgi:glycosyltransferase involved in cell wall biosynthesis